MSRLLLPLVAIVLAIACGLPAATAAAAELKTIKTPSMHVDAASVEFNGADHPGELLANVLLPDGYDAKRRYPVLFLLHGVGDSYSSWVDPIRGDILNTAAGLDAIIVMPEAARGFYANWWNDGLRGDPSWERFYLEKLVPLVERRFAIKSGRRWHAIAGLSMGGLGATFLGSQLPGYFGSVASFSGFVQHQRPEAGPGLQLVAGVPYEEIFGPQDGFYASGHNPTELAANLRSSRLYVAVGNGLSSAEELFDPLGAVRSGVVEAELFLQAQEFVTAAREAEVDLRYRPQSGIHAWVYWRRHLREAIEWGLFEKVPAKPTSWDYTTVSQRGEAWGLRYRFADAPTELETLSREKDRLRGEGSGELTLRTAAGCRLRVTLPFDRAFPGRDCSKRR